MKSFNTFNTLVLLVFSMTFTCSADQPQTTKQLAPVQTWAPKILLQKTVEHFSKDVTDYTGTFFKQERINDKICDPQEIDFKFKTKPHSIFMEWKNNPGKIDKLLYVENANDNKALLHPRGVFSWIKSVKRAPNDKDIMKSTLKPCTEFGFEKIAKSMLKEFKDYNVKFISSPCHSLEGGNPALKSLAEGEANSEHTQICTIIKFELSTDNPKKGSPTKVTVTYDTNIHAPIERIAYNKQNLLMYSYTYKNLKFNTNLTDKNFTQKATGM